MGPLGTVDPFDLQVVEDPSGSGRLAVEARAAPGARMPLERAGLNLVGAGQALLGLSLRWMARAGREPPDDALRGPAEVRLLVRRREANLMALLLRRHVDRLHDAPAWMADFLQALGDIEVLLQWEKEG